jgi:hypothetical protein
VVGPWHGRLPLAPGDVTDDTDPSGAGPGPAASGDLLFEMRAPAPAPSPAGYGGIDPAFRPSAPPLALSAFLGPAPSAPSSLVPGPGVAR